MSTRVDALGTWESREGGWVLVKASAAFRKVMDDAAATALAAAAPDPTDAMRLAACLSISPKVVAAELDDATVAALAPLYDQWKPGLTVKPGDLYAWDGTIVECIQGHTTQADWTPDVTPALWKVHRTVTGPAPDPWVQPTGGHDAYKKGDRVTHKGQVWESTADANVWEPGVYGWVVV